MKQALKLEDQGQFHPIKYAKALLEKAIENGVEFLRNLVLKLLNRNTVELMEGQQIRANKILVCSHFPFNDGDGLYFARMHPERSYALASIAPTNYPKGMYINVEKPTRSVRTALGSRW